MSSQEPPTDNLDTGIPLPLPDDYCQLSITHPAYSAPLLWVCTKMANLMAVIARWSHPQKSKTIGRYAAATEEKGEGSPSYVYDTSKDRAQLSLAALLGELRSHSRAEGTNRLSLLPTG